LLLHFSQYTYSTSEIKVFGGHYWFYYRYLERYSRRAECQKQSRLCYRTLRTWNVCMKRSMLSWRKQSECVCWHIIWLSINLITK
jgi:hypothetical protein